MKAILRRKFERIRQPPSEPAHALTNAAAIIGSRRRHGELNPASRAACEEGIRLQIPGSRFARRRSSSIAAPIVPARELFCRQRCFRDCQAASTEMSRAVTEQARAAAQTRSVEFERECQSYSFASCQAFLGNCGQDGLPTKQTPKQKGNQA
jgi:hypothetical protein